ncbi:hypothetical protein [Demequina pelophila]|uniref:hypothetical protein n=1 Tax=Demequina pelophila TaxID=1638984 RepID=UPI0007857C51|nr:hypothetical protein [Demequina pelophila]
MVAVLVGLRRALQRGAREGTATRVLIWMGLVAAGLGGFALVAFLGWNGAAPGTTHLVLPALLSGILVCWLLLPLAAPQFADQTVDPARLEMFPLTTREKVAGLAAGAVLSRTALPTFLTVCGLAVVAGAPLWARLLVPVLAALYTAVCVIASRTVQATLARFASSRRGRDVGVILAAAFTLAVYLGSQALGGVTGEAVAAAERAGAGGWLAWTPGGVTARAVTEAADGPAAAAIAVVVLAACVAALLGSWVLVFARRESGSGGGGRSRGRRTDAESGPRLALVPWWMRPLEALATGPDARVALAAAAQHVRYLCFRHATAAQRLAMAAVLGGVICFPMAGDGDLVGGALGFCAYAALQVAMPVFGFDGPGITYLDAAAGRVRPVLWGKALVSTALVWIMGAVYVVVLAAVSGNWAGLASGLVMAGAGSAWACAVAVGAGVFAPVDVTRKATNMGRVFGSLTLVLLAGGLGVAVLGIGTWALGFYVPPLVAAFIALAVAAGGGALLLRAHAARAERDFARVAAAIPAPA